jgi:outer membrane murein-binding lipoprotein Lpp
MEPHSQGKNVKLLIAASVLALLAGCASHGKSDDAIYREAADAHVMTLPAGQNKVSLPATKIQSHGLIADNLAIAAGGGANATLLKQQLLIAKSAGESGFLIIGAGTSLDVAILKNAFESLDLNGMRIYYAGGEGQKDAARSAVEKTQAKFQYISVQ